MQLHVVQTMWLCVQQKDTHRMLPLQVIITLFYFVTTVGKQKCGNCRNWKPSSSSAQMHKGENYSVLRQSLVISATAG